MENKKLKNKEVVWDTYAFNLKESTAEIRNFLNEHFSDPAKEVVSVSSFNNGKDITTVVVSRKIIDKKK